MLIQYQKPTVIVQKITLCKLICTSITTIMGVDDLDVNNEGTDDAGITTGNSRLPSNPLSP